MPHHWKITIIVVAAAAIISTPLVWLLDSPNSGQLVGASVQAATGISALLWAIFSGSSAHAPAGTVVRRTGAAVARGGGRAIAGIMRRADRDAAPAIAENTGPSTAVGEGSLAVSGSMDIDGRAQ
ncbi:hypothetical protein [Streptomyces europaeiscabiei]|uniref:hypothetical protein n=1 Tax=Streptomyces europaeiscabiei TaxID=146819 RepID=UPI0038F604AF